MYQYGAEAQRAIDGDTLVVTVDLGFRLTMTQVVRVAGINAPEANTPAGRAAAKALQGWLFPPDGVREIDDWVGGNSSFVITTTKPHDKYGRWLATVTRCDGHDLADDMIAAGHAVAWDGHGAKPVPS